MNFETEKSDFHSELSHLEDKFCPGRGCNPEELSSALKSYSDEVSKFANLDVPVEQLCWEISHRSKRRAGAVFHRNGDPTTVQFSWDFFLEKGWSSTAETARHELIHIHLLRKDSDPSHGKEFKKLASRLETNIHCKEFSEPKWIAECVDCGNEFKRYIRSKLIKNPSKYRCGDCHGKLAVRKNPSPD